MYNQLLQRQIRKYLNGAAVPPQELHAIFEAISASYDQFETDHRLIERAMDLSSEELTGINDQLGREVERQRIVLGKLKDSLTTLDSAVLPQKPMSHEDELIAVADLLHELIARQREAERKLQKSEALFRLITENASDLIVRYDASGACTYISPSCLPMLGYRQGELIGKTVFDLMHDHDKRGTAAALRRAINERTPFAITARIRRRDGVHRWFETTIRVLRDPETDEVVEYHTTARDVSERVETAERLRATTMWLATLIENLEAGILVEDSSQRITLANQNFCDLFRIPLPPAMLVGTDSAEGARKGMDNFVDPEIFFARRQEIAARRETVVGEQLRLVDGRILERDFVPIVVDGIYSGNLWSYRDISARIQAQEELRRTSSRLSALVGSLEGGVIVTDDVGQIAVINKTFCRLYSISATPEELIGRDSAVIQEAAMRCISNPEQIVAEAQEAMDRREAALCKELTMVDGRRVEYDYIPIFLGPTYAGHLWHCRDVTERKQAELRVQHLNEELNEANRLLRNERDLEKERVRALQELNSMKNEFVSSVSHELRTPLASIIGFAQTMMIDPDLPIDMRQEFLQIVYDEGKRLAKLIDDLLDISRIESGRTELEKRTTDITALLERCLVSISPQANAKHIRVVTEYESPAIEVMCDPDRVAQVVINLLGNAVKFTPEGGTVTMKVCADTGFVAISVSDTGMGIPEEALPHIFDKFYRVHRPGLEIRGTGLGLAIARQLIEMHKGTIDVESRVQQGSTFTVRLPYQ